MGKHRRDEHTPTDEQVDVEKLTSGAPASPAGRGRHATDDNEQEEERGGVATFQSGP